MDSPTPWPQNAPLADLEAAQAHDLVQHLNQQLTARVAEQKRDFTKQRTLTPTDLTTDLPEKTYDLITSPLLMHWTDPKAHLLACGKALQGDGLLLASTLGSESFREFQAAFAAAELGDTPHTLPLPDVRDVGMLLSQLDFALPVVDRDMLTLTYPDFATLYEDLRAAGSRNLHPARRHGLISRQQWQQMETAYREHFATADGDLPLTLEVIYLHAWRPHKSQPKPLEPGQYKVKFEDVM